MEEKTTKENNINPENNKESPKKLEQPSQEKVKFKHKHQN